MPRELLIPIARKAGDKQLCHPTDSGVRDVKCECPQCGREVVHRQGERYRPHFAHKAQTNCTASTESLVHLAAKEIIGELGFIWLPSINLVFELSGVVLEEEAKQHAFRQSEKEVSRQTADGTLIRPDMVLTDNDGRDIAVEITYRHPTGDEKKAIFPALNLPCIELNLSSLPPTIPLGELRKMIATMPENYSWMFNRRLARLAQIEAEKRRELQQAIRAENAAKQKEERKMEREAQRVERELRHKIKTEAIQLPVKWRRLLSRIKATPHADDCPKRIRSARGRTFANVVLDCRHCDCYGGTVGAWPEYSAIRCGWYIRNAATSGRALAAVTPWWLEQPEPPREIGSGDFRLE